MRVRLRPASVWQHPRAPIRVLANEARPKLRRAFREALRLPATLLDTEKATRLIGAGRIHEVADAIDWVHHGEALRYAVAGIGDVWNGGARIGSQRINRAFANRGQVVRFRKDIADAFNYDRFSPDTVDRIRAYQDALIQGLSDDARAAIEAAVLRGLRAGDTAETIAEDISGVLGLTPQQTLAAYNYRLMVESLDPTALARRLASAADTARLQAAIRNGTPLDQALVDEMVLRYEEAALEQRALTIARTEATRAASMGLQDSYLQAIDRGVMPAGAVRQFWQVALDERTCPHCLSIVDLNPDGVPLGQSFDSDEGPVDVPPLHTNCRCSLELVTNLDLVPEVA